MSNLLAFIPYDVYNEYMSNIRKMVPLKEDTHAKLTRLLQKEIVQKEGVYTTYNEMVEKLVNFYEANTFE